MWGGRTPLIELVPGEILPVGVPLFECWAVVGCLAITQIHELIHAAFSFLTTVANTHHTVPTGALSVAHVSVLNTKRNRGKMKRDNTAPLLDHCTGPTLHKQKWKKKPSTDLNSAGDLALCLQHLEAKKTMKEVTVEKQSCAICGTWNLRSERTSCIYLSSSVYAGLWCKHQARWWWITTLDGGTETPAADSMSADRWAICLSASLQNVSRRCCCSFQAIRHWQLRIKCYSIWQTKASKAQCGFKKKKKCRVRTRNEPERHNSVNKNITRRYHSDGRDPWNCGVRAAERDWLNKEVVLYLRFDSFLFVPGLCVLCAFANECRYSPVRTWNLGRSWWRAAQCWSGPGRQMNSFERHPQREAPSHWRWAGEERDILLSMLSHKFISDIIIIFFAFMHDIVDARQPALNSIHENAEVKMGKNHQYQGTASDMNCLFWCTTEASRIYLFTVCPQQLFTCAPQKSHWHWVCLSVNAAKFVWGCWSLAGDCKASLVHLMRFTSVVASFKENKTNKKATLIVMVCRGEKITILQWQKYLKVDTWWFSTGALLPILQLQ